MRGDQKVLNQSLPHISINVGNQAKIILHTSLQY